MSKLVIAGLTRNLCLASLFVWMPAQARHDSL